MTTIEERIRASVEALDGSTPGLGDVVTQGRRRRRRTRAIAGCAAAVLLVASLAGAAELMGSTSSGGRAGDPAGSRHATGVLPPDQRDEPIELAGSSAEGLDLDVADLRGSVVVVRVWFVGCPPCRRDVGVLTAAVDRPGVEGLGIAAREESRATVRTEAREIGMPFDSILGPLPTAMRSVAHALPSTWVLDRQGRVAFTALGDLAPGDLDPAIDELLAERDSSWELAVHGGRHCPESMPLADAETHGFGPDTAALAAPTLSVPDEVWRCSYRAVDVAPRGSGGATYEWQIVGEPVRLDDQQVARFSSAVAELAPPSGEGVRTCKADLGPRHLFAFDQGGDLTGVVVDDFGCGDVRLTDEPFETVAGESTQPGVVAGVLAAPDGAWKGLLD